MLPGTCLHDSDLVRSLISVTRLATKLYCYPWLFSSTNVKSRQTVTFISKVFIVLLMEKTNWAPMLHDINSNLETFKIFKEATRAFAPKNVNLTYEELRVPAETHAAKLFFTSSWAENWALNIR